MNVNTENLDKTIEHWASIDGYLNYQVSWFGRVANTKTGRILKPGTNNSGYLFVILSKNGKVKIHYIHKLVAREWVPNPEEKRCVDHRDGDRTNNHFENLRYATDLENQWNKKRRKAGSSLYKGVSWDKRSGEWVVRIKVDSVYKYLGLFEIEKEAAEVYNAAALKFYKKFARLNELD